MVEEPSPDTAARNPGVRIHVRKSRGPLPGDCTSNSLRSFLDDFFLDLSDVDSAFSAYFADSFRFFYVNHPEPFTALSVEEVIDYWSDFDADAQPSSI